MEYLNSLTSLGLFWDGFGVFILGVPAFFRLSSEIRNEAGTYYSYNIHEVRNKVATRLDVGVGSLLLVGGFLLQLISSLKINFDQSFILVLWFFCPVSAICYYLFGRGMAITNLTKRIEDLLKADIEKKRSERDN